MTLRQTFLRFIYPVWMLYNKLLKKKSRVLRNERNVQPIQSFYTLSVYLNNGKEFRFESLKGKKVMLVNTASDCGYTNQYDDLQKLHENFNDKLTVIGFPANDFREQEKGNDEEIAQFCKINFGVTFPLAKKNSVKKGKDQQEVFQWLTDRSRNGWNNKQPSRNFSKYLVDEQGILTNYFDPAVSPLSEQVIKEVGNR
jgi:glutathione peroxidase